MFKRPRREDFPFFRDNVRVNMDIDELIPGCREPDCIPSIDSPTWIDGQAALRMYSKEDLVMAALMKGQCFVVPLRILNWHEIINFQLENGLSVGMSYCPLCQTITAYERKIKDATVELGVSGLLWNSALVMYDRRTLSLFSQVLSLGIVGKYVNQKLVNFPVIQATLKEVLEVFPRAFVLSLDTGSRRMRNYQKKPYEEYRKSNKIIFPVSHQDDLLHPKTLVYTVEEKHGQSLIIPLENLSAKSPLQVVSGLWSVPIAGSFLFFDSESDLGHHLVSIPKNPSIEDLENLLGAKWRESHLSFYFAARAYHPEALIFYNE